MKKFFWLLTVFLICSSLQCAAENRALIIGISEYPMVRYGWNRLHGREDAIMLTNAFRQNGFVVDSLTNSRATKRNILLALERLANNANPGDKIYFHFSGHGQPVQDLNGDERNGCDEAIVPYDASHKVYIEDVYIGEKHIIDDELNPYFIKIKNKIGPQGQFFITIDACHSRDIEKGQEEELEDPEVVEWKRGTDKAFSFKNPKKKPQSLNSAKAPKTYSSHGGTMYVLTACSESESNFEKQVTRGIWHGSLSYGLSILLKKGVDFEKWATYFNTPALYQRDRVFEKIQHPSCRKY